MSKEPCFFQQFARVLDIYHAIRVLKLSKLICKWKLNIVNGNNKDENFILKFSYKIT